MSPLTFVFLLPLAVVGEHFCDAGDSSCNSDTSALLQKAVNVHDSAGESKEQQQQQQQQQQAMQELQEAYLQLRQHYFGKDNSTETDNCRVMKKVGDGGCTCTHDGNHEALYNRKFVQDPKDLDDVKADCLKDPKCTGFSYDQKRKIYDFIPKEGGEKNYDGECGYGPPEKFIKEDGYECWKVVEVPPIQKLGNGGCTCTHDGNHEALYNRKFVQDPKDLDDVKAECLKDPMCTGFSYGLNSKMYDLIPKEGGETNYDGECGYGPPEEFIKEDGYECWKRTPQCH